MSDSPYWNPKTETMPREELSALQAKKLRAVVARAYEKSAFHRRLLDGGKVRPSTRSDSMVSCWASDMRVPLDHVRTRRLYAGSASLPRCGGGRALGGRRGHRGR